MTFEHASAVVKAPEPIEGDDDYEEEQKEEDGEEGLLNFTNTLCYSSLVVHNKLLPNQRDSWPHQTGLASRNTSSESRRETTSSDRSYTREGEHHLLRYFSCSKTTRAEPLDELPRDGVRLTIRGSCEVMTGRASTVQRKRVTVGGIRVVNETVDIDKTLSLG
nr:hypothetical protein HmN_001001000 [Hymenolepis microstoma]